MSSKQERYTWVVPSPGPKDQFMLIPKLFAPAARCVILLFNLFVPIVVHFFAKFCAQILQSEHKRFRSLSGIYFTSFCITVANAMQHNARTTYFRIFTFLWAIYSLHIYSIVATQLISLMTHMPLEPLMTHYDIMHGGIPIKLTNATAQFFTVTEHYARDNVLNMSKGYQMCDSLKRCLTQVATERFFNIFNFFVFVLYNECFLSSETWPCPWAETISVQYGTISETIAVNSWSMKSGKTLSKRLLTCISRR